MKRSLFNIYHIFALCIALFLSGCHIIQQELTSGKRINDNAFDFFENVSSSNDKELDDNELYEGEINRSQTNHIHEKFYKKISISSTADMSISNILNKMAQMIDVNIYIPPTIDGGITFQAKEKSFIKILDNLCNLLDMKYEIKEDSISIEFDVPVTKMYDMNFLNIIRDTNNNICTSTDIFMNQSIADVSNNSNNNSNNNFGNGNAANGSNYSISSNSKSNFWQELEESLKLIINENNTDESGKGSIAFHKQAGIITISTTEKKHKKIEKFLESFKNSSESQVLIEAKILEVSLNNDYKNGINWSLLDTSGRLMKYDNAYDQQGSVIFGIKNGNDTRNSQFIANLIEKCGTIKTLSNPRITVLNNQTAIMKVARNEVIYLPEIQRQYPSVNDTRSTDIVSTSIKTIPIGLVMSVQPSINKKQNSVLLTIKPMISRISSYKEVPFVYQIGSNNDTTNNNKSTTTQNQQIPQVEIKEFDSVLKLFSGQVVVLGGLMNEKTYNNNKYLPHTVDTPLSWLTGNTEKGKEITELVIFLRVTIIGNKKSAYHATDKKIYTKFTNDPRKLEFIDAKNHKKVCY